MKFLIVITVLAFALTAADDDGFVKVRNNGSYVAIFRETYNLDGQTISKSSKPFPILQSRTIDIPNTMTNSRGGGRLKKGWIKKFSALCEEFSHNFYYFKDKFKTQLFPQQIYECATR
ncbi:hypothetical protein V9T40_001747 [Parthenolecanium corni]|uniref:Uncharacterized protein n=1 Tax=Parthenolecanium corni TaxID=536013 RepID=A0AAN9Y3G6_9HEMI